MTWLHWVLIGAAGYATILGTILAMMKRGKQEDHARWRAAGFDPEQVENEIESEALAEWQDRQTIKSMEKSMRRGG